MQYLQHFNPDTSLDQPRNAKQSDNFQSKTLWSLEPFLKSAFQHGACTSRDMEEAHASILLIFTQLNLPFQEFGMRECNNRVTVVPGFSILGFRALPC